MSKSDTTSPGISLGGEDAVVSRSGQSRKVVAKVLGRETDPDTGKETIWLDRLLHRAGEDVFMQGEVPWKVSGAISTILTTVSTASHP